MHRLILLGVFCLGVLVGCSLPQETHPFAVVKLEFTKLEEEPLVIFETQYWYVVLKENQTLPGASIIRLKRPLGSFTKLTKEEWFELHEVMRQLDIAVKGAFGATLTNWRMLMNHAYRFEPYMPLVHLHFDPRYERPVEFNGEIFIDEKFGSALEGDSKTHEVDDAMRHVIIKELKKYITLAP